MLTGNIFETTGMPNCAGTATVTRLEIERMGLWVADLLSDQQLAAAAERYNAKVALNKQFLLSLHALRLVCSVHGPEERGPTPLHPGAPPLGGPSSSASSTRRLKVCRLATPSPIPSPSSHPSLPHPPPIPPLPSLHCRLYSSCASGRPALQRLPSGRRPRFLRSLSLRLASVSPPPQLYGPLAFTAAATIRLTSASVIGRSISCCLSCTHPISYVYIILCDVPPIE